MIPKMMLNDKENNNNIIPSKLKRNDRIHMIYISIYGSTYGSNTIPKDSGEIVNVHDNRRIKLHRTAM